MGVYGLKTGILKFWAVPPAASAGRYTTNFADLGASGGGCGGPGKAKVARNPPFFKFILKKGGLRGRPTKRVLLFFLILGWVAGTQTLFWGGRRGFLGFFGAFSLARQGAAKDVGRGRGPAQR